MLAYLQLVRLPAVFTAMADIILGYVLTHGGIFGPDGWIHPQKFCGLLLSSCCLYLSGMVFNDVFDRKQDAEERPNRPIPSGRVSLRSAIVLGTLLMAGGVTFAALVAQTSLIVAGLLVLAILGYDGFLKRTFLGPLAMGSCRFLNVLLGASDQIGMPDLLSRPQLLAAIGLGIYIVGVTLFARTEAKTSSRWQLGLAQGVFDAGILTLAYLIVSWPKFRWPPDRNAQIMSLAMLAVIAFTLNRRALAAIADPSPTRVQLTIKLLLLSYVMLDASLVYWKMYDSPLATGHAMTTAALIIPAMVLSRFIPMT
jgi:4-hydroxybenzoate polyprenyltransferase